MLLPQASNCSRQSDSKVEVLFIRRGQAKSNFNHLGPIIWFSLNPEKASKPV